jgi:hypothetical protein
VLRDFRTALAGLASLVRDQVGEEENLRRNSKSGGDTSNDLAWR